MPAYTFKEDINWVKKIDPYEEGVFPTPGRSIFLLNDST